MSVSQVCHRDLSSDGKFSTRFYHSFFIPRTQILLAFRPCENIWVLFLFFLSNRYLSGYFETSNRDLMIYFVSFIMV